MATITFNGESFTVDHAVKGENYVHGYDANSICVISLDGISDFSGIEYDGTYMEPGECLAEECNTVRYCNGAFKTAGGDPIEVTGSGGVSLWYTPSVDSEGDLSWTPSTETVNNLPVPVPETVNIKGPAGADGKSAYAYAKDGGYTGTEAEFAEKLACGYSGVTVMDYGAKGDGSTDDTAAFQEALAENRTVYVPGGTYKLSGMLEIGENCELELSQDALLSFTQTSGNCIELRRSATLRGNHGTIFVPYAFTGNVVACDTALDGSVAATVPPYLNVHLQLQYQRFIHDVNIMKPNENGEFRSTDGTCSGTAVYLSADGTATFTYMWGVTLSGIRIAGAFSYGIRAANYDDPNKYTDNAWNHDMRIEAVIEACEVGVSMENCNGAHLAVTVQPNQSRAGTGYAKWGVYLNDSRFIDMVGSRIWDWNANNSLWTNGGQHQHLAMIGNCRGLILDDFLYYETSYDIRNLIYTDTASNLEQMTILQEPITRWFKPVDNKPYFFDGTSNKALMLKTEKITAEQTDFIHPADGYYTYTPNFTNLVNGYADGVYVHQSGTAAHSGYVTTDFIPIDGATDHTYRISGEGITWDDSYGYCRIAWYDSSKTIKGSVMSWDKIGSNEYYPVKVEDDTVVAAFSTNANVAPPNGAAYFRVTAKGRGANLIVTVDEKVDYTSVWHGEPKRLDESIHALNDWNAAEGEPGHVLNRTHYEETGAVVMPETTLALLDDGYFAVEYTGDPLVAGKPYAVFYNGQKYICAAYMSEGNVCIGSNPTVGVNTGEPFFAVPMEGMLLVMPWDGATTCVMSILENNVVKLPERFLPYERYEVDFGEIEVDNENKSERNYDDIAAALYAKRNVVFVSNITLDDGNFMMHEMSVLSWSWHSTVGLLVYCVTASSEIQCIIFPNGTWTPPTA